MNDTQIVAAGEGPDLAIMKRLDVGAIFQKFDQELAPIFEQSLAIVATDEPQYGLAKSAGTQRKAIKQLRLIVSKREKELLEPLKEQIDEVKGAAAAIVARCKEEEERLEEIEKFVQRQEAERREELYRYRADQLHQYGANPGIYRLGDMSEEEFDGIVEDAYQKFKAAEEAARIETAAQAERDRLAAEEENRIRLENDRLKAEASRVEEERRIEREAAEAKQREIEETARIERQKIEAKARAEREEAERLAKIERDRIAEENRVKFEAEQKKQREAAEEARKLREEKEAREAAERAKEAERIEAERKAAAAPDKAKLEALAIALEAVPIPEMATQAGTDIARWVAVQRAKLCEALDRKANSL